MFSAKNLSEKMQVLLKFWQIQAESARRGIKNTILCFELYGVQVNLAPSLQSEKELLRVEFILGELLNAYKTLSAQARLTPQDFTKKCSLKQIIVDGHADNPEQYRLHNATIVLKTNCEKTDIEYILAEFILLQEKIREEKLQAAVSELQSYCQAHNFTVQVADSPLSIQKNCLKMAVELHQEFSNFSSAVAFPNLYFSSSKGQSTSFQYEKVQNILSIRTNISKTDLKKIITKLLIQNNPEPQTPLELLASYIEHTPLLQFDLNYFDSLIPEDLKLVRRLLNIFHSDRFHNLENSQELEVIKTITQALILKLKILSRH